jgi:hypothetical protein
MKFFSKRFWGVYSSDTVLISWVFLRVLALIYFSAFASMSVQIEGLVGANGILPAVSRLAWVEQFYQQKFWQMPTLFWLNVSDSMLIAVCYAGMVAASLLLLNIFTRAALITCYVLYLSIVEVGQNFTHFQWDAFLLETGFLAIFLTWGSGIIILLFRWLLARFMFMGGVVKIASGDPAWTNLTALGFHYETQPLPSPIAYYAYHLPTWFHKVCVGGMFFIELVVPFFVFLPRRFQVFACIAFIMLQSAIILTGNYTFFNLLTILLCLFLLQDKDIAKILPNRLVAIIQQEKPVAGIVANTCAGLWANIVMVVCASQIWLYHVNMPTFGPLKTLIRTTSTFSLVNNYGPFAVMTRTRNEIIIQGSYDALNWSDYSFKYKPGKLNHELGWNIPHQPRLDWQMWFEALNASQKSAWFDSFLVKLLEGSPQILSLLDDNPFPEKPPRYIRAIIYRYSYTQQEQRDKNGQIWQRQDGRIYSPTITFKNTSSKNNVSR